jgi:hypothetical protein
MYQFKYNYKGKRIIILILFFYLGRDYDITIDRFRSNYPHSWNYILLSKQIICWT